LFWHRNEKRSWNCKTSLQELVRLFLARNSFSVIQTSQENCHGNLHLMIPRRQSGLSRLSVSQAADYLFQITTYSREYGAVIARKSVELRPKAPGYILCMKILRLKSGNLSVNLVSNGQGSIVSVQMGSTYIMGNHRFIELRRRLLCFAARSKKSPALGDH
jgi:hypothetical protein